MSYNYSGFRAPSTLPGYRVTEFASRLAGKHGRLGKYVLPNKNMPKRLRENSNPFQVGRTKYHHNTGNVTAVNMLSTKASKKVTGRQNVMSIRGNDEYVSVSKNLRAKIKKVIKKDAAWGTYVTSRTGDIGIVQPLGDTVKKTIQQGGYTDALIAIQTGSTDIKADVRWWVQGIYANTVLNVVGDEFQYFTPLKFLDAASVLWNQKALTKDYGSQTDNFTNSATIATGGTIIGTPGAPDKKGVDLHVINSYVTWEMKNTSQRMMYIDIYHCVPKVKHPEQLPLDAFYNGIAAMQQSDTSLGVLLTTDAADSNDELAINPALEPNVVESFNTMYKYEKLEIIIQPGETCKHSIQGPKNLDINFSKFYEGSEDKGGLMWNQSSICAMVSIRPSMVYATNGVTLSAGDGGGRWTRSTYNASDLNVPVSIEVQETFVMSCPDDTGFIRSSVDSGVVQTLNLKRKVRAYSNFTNSISGTDINYQGFNKENPGDAINEAQLF